MKIGKVLVEQVKNDGLQVMGYDESLSPSEMFNLLSRYFVGIKKSTTDSRFYIGEYKGHKYALRSKNVTYLGNPHPLYKKRIQIAEDLFDFIDYALSINAKPLLLGLYKYQDTVIFVFFKLDTYIERKAHNSSAHIYISDLSAAAETGYFQKVDFFGNTITAVSPNALEVYLDEVFDSSLKIKQSKTNSEANETLGYDESFAPDAISYPEGRKAESLIEHYSKIDGTSEERFSSYAKVFREQIVPKIRSFFIDEDKEWNGIDCYKKMIAANYRNKFQAEWAGTFLEYEFEKYLSDNSLNNLITYAQDKTTGGIDLDLFFPTIESYGDLKAHSEGSRGIQGNDWSTIFGIINNQDGKSHVYYIVCEHSTEKDSMNNYEVTHFWNESQHKKDPMSYSTRMKNRVRLKKVYFLDINYSNREYLTKFKQGLNSNGKPREPKIMIEHDKLQYFIVDQMTL